LRDEPRTLANEQYGLSIAFNHQDKPTRCKALENSVAHMLLPGRWQRYLAASSRFLSCCSRHVSSLCKLGNCSPYSCPLPSAVFIFRLSIGSPVKRILWLLGIPRSYHFLDDPHQLTFSPATHYSPCNTASSNQFTKRKLTGTRDLQWSCPSKILVGIIRKCLAGRSDLGLTRSAPWKHSVGTDKKPAVPNGGSKEFSYEDGSGFGP
jgi:hypothetical protein